MAAISENRSPAVDGPVEIMLGVYKAAETGKVVKLPPTSDPVLDARKMKVRTSWKMTLHYSSEPLRRCTATMAR